MGVNQYLCCVTFHIQLVKLKGSEPLLNAGVFHKPLLGQWTGLDGFPPKFTFSLEPQILTILGNRVSADISG